MAERLLLGKFACMGVHGRRPGEHRTHRERGIGIFRAKETPGVDRSLCTTGGAHIPDMAINNDSVTTSLLFFGRSFLFLDLEKFKYLVVGPAGEAFFIGGQSQIQRGIGRAESRAF